MTRFLLALIAAAVLVALPPFLGLGWQNTLTNMLIAALFAAAFNLLMGQGGMLSFGHAAYYGLGAFAVLHLMLAIENGFNFPTALLPLAGAGVGLIAGLGAGFFAAKRTGVYFSLVTLALAELLHAIAPHWQGLFGGEAGLSSMRMPSWGLEFGTSLEVYYVTLAWVVVSIGLLYAYTLTPFGRLTLALRDNEQRVRFMGFDPHRTKVLVFGISAMFAGIAGGLLAMSQETANYNIFSMAISSQVVLQTFVGGSTLFLGPVLGAAVLTVFTFLISEMTRAWMLYQGLLFVLIMLFAPNGIAGVIQLHIDARDRLPWARLTGPYALATAAGAVATTGLVMLVHYAELIFADAYRARVARDGLWEPVSAFGIDWNPLNPVTWLVPVALIVLGILGILKMRGPIAQLWATPANIPPTAAMPAPHAA